MEFTFGKGSQLQKSGRLHKRRKQIKLSSEEDRKYSRYNHNLQFYSIPPTDTITLTEFDEFAVNRLKVLKHIESAGIKHLKTTVAYKEALEKELKTLMPIATKLTKIDEPVKASTYEERRKDHISHFILRLAYCRSDELRRWFITQELELFRYRFCRETQDSIAPFLEQNDLYYKPIPDEEKTELRTELQHASPTTHAQMVESSDFFKVHFTEALDLIRHRKVYLKKGFAYIPRNDLISIIMTVYRERLSHALAVTARSIPHLEEDNRLMPLLNTLSQQYLGQDYSSKKLGKGEISLDQINPLSRSSFPLCMRQLHESLKENHHLKHFGRMQYGLFLKAIGLTLEQALLFWRSEFAKIMDSDKFDKSYAYNIRHNYGKEGKRADYTPYSCLKIIMSNPPATGDYHGCPFRHSDASILRQRLASYGVSQERIKKIMDFVSGSHYQLACSAYFEATHHLENSDFNVNHPNEYFEESQKILNGIKNPDSSQRSTPSSQLSGGRVSGPADVGNGDDFGEDLSFREIEEMDKLVDEDETA